MDRKTLLTRKKPKQPPEKRPRSTHLPAHAWAEHNRRVVLRHLYPDLIRAIRAKEG